MDSLIKTGSGFGEGVKSRLKVSLHEPQSRGMFGLIGIEEVHFSLPYNPNGKSHVEAWFRVTARFCRDWRSYAGHSVGTKPEELAKILENPMLAPTFEEVRDEFAKFVAAWNASADHSIDDLVDQETGIRLSPDEAMAHWCQRRKVFNEAALDLCLQHWHQPVRAHRNGVTIAPFGQRFAYGFADTALTPYKVRGRNGKKPPLHVSFDPNDLSRVRVYTEKLEYVATLKRNERGARGNREQVSRLMKLKRQYAKALDFIESNRELEYLTAAELMMLENAKREPAKPTSEPSLKLIQTPLDDQSSVIGVREEYQELRKVVGGFIGSAPNLPAHQAMAAKRAAKAAPAIPLPPMTSLARLNYGAVAGSAQEASDE